VPNEGPFGNGKFSQPILRIIAQAWVQQVDRDSEGFAEESHWQKLEQKLFHRHHPMLQSNLHPTRFDARVPRCRRIASGKLFEFPVGLSEMEFSDSDIWIFSEPWARDDEACGTGLDRRILTWRRQKIGPNRATFFATNPTEPRCTEVSGKLSTWPVEPLFQRGERQSGGIKVDVA
jgi:hypothetical protein